MKLTLIPFFIILFFCAKTIAQEKAVSYRAVARLDAVYNFSGGLEQGACYLGEADIAVGFDTEKAGWWKGTELFFQAMNTHGKDPSAALVGDVQAFSNITAPNHTSMYEMWVKQTMLNDKVEVMLGQIDINADFIISDNATNFINSSFGVLPSISLNNTISIFPLLASGAVLKIMPSDAVKFQTALYNGYPGDFDNNPYGINWKFKKSDGLFSIPELHYAWIRDSIPVGVYKIGGYYHSGDYTNTDSGSSVRDNYGFYAIADQRVLTTPNSERSLNIFGELGWTPSDRNVYDLAWTLGMRMHSPFAFRPNDDLGVGVASVRLADHYVESSPDTIQPHETAIEITYKLQITDEILIQPDVQYIIHPGANRTVENSFVGFIRTTIKF